MHTMCVATMIMRERTSWHIAVYRMIMSAGDNEILGLHVKRCRSEAEPGKVHGSTGGVKICNYIIVTAREIEKNKILFPF